MDSFTQLVLGAAVGQAVAHRRLGGQALALGAIGGVLPDLDVMASWWSGPFAEWQSHRGVTHSLFFGPVVGPLLGWGLWRAYRRWRPRSVCAGDDALGPMIAVLILAIVTHPLLDLFTIYGTQLLAPFSEARFAVPAVAIIDPFYTVPLLIAAVIGMTARARRWAVAAAAVALTLSSVYLFYAWDQNQRAEAEARRQLAGDGLRHADVRAYTTIFQPWLRRLVVHEENGVRVGFLSTWAPTPIAWTCLRRSDHPAVDRATATPEAQILNRFASGQVWPSVHRDDHGRVVVRLTDLRYGVPGPTIAGWWGVDIAFAAGGEIVQAARIALPRPPLSTAAIAAVFQGGTGDLSGFYQVALAGDAPPACHA